MTSLPGGHVSLMRDCVYNRKVQYVTILHSTSALFVLFVPHACPSSLSPSLIFPLPAFFSPSHLSPYSLPLLSLVCLLPYHSYWNDHLAVPISRLQLKFSWTENSCSFCLDLSDLIVPKIALKVFCDLATLKKCIQSRTAKFPNL